MRTMQDNFNPPPEPRDNPVLVQGSGKTGAHPDNAPAISDVSEQTPTKLLAANLILIDDFLREPNKDGSNAALDFSMVTSAAMTYCRKSATYLHQEKTKL